MKEVPVLLTDDMTEVQIKAFRLSVNRFSELADWDVEQLKLELEELDELQYDIELLDFTDLNLGDEPWDSDIDDLKAEKNLDGIEATIRVTCDQDKKDEIMVFIKRELIEAGFEGVHVT